METPPVEILVFIFLLQNSTPSPWNIRPTLVQEPTCMTLTVDSFSTSSGFISSCDPGITAGHPGGPDGCLSRAYHVPPCGLLFQGSLSSRRSHWLRRLSRACDGRNMGQIPISALLWQTTRGQLEMHHRQAHKVKCSTAEHSPCPATTPQELKRAQHTHCPPGARSCPPIHA